MKIVDLAKALESASITGDPRVEVQAVSYDSRKVKPGDLFVAVHGLKMDGRGFIEPARTAGAAAILIEGQMDEAINLPVISVPDVRLAMAQAAAVLADRPAERMTMVGLTGTNGKTTTTYLIESILKEAGFSPGVLGTVTTRFAGRCIPAALTTPESPDLQATLKEMFAQGVSHVVMEVSSHALALSRVAGCPFDVGVFTNLTQDHLDFHGDLEAYFQTKKRLFTELLNGRHLPGGPQAVINVDDLRGQALAKELGDAALTFGIESPAHVRAMEVVCDRAGIQASLETPAGPLTIQSRLLGMFNLYNLLAATATALVLGIETDHILRGLAAITEIPGRLERVGAKNEYLVLVDYAHTPDALTRVLMAVRDLRPERIILVFGCGGDRDRGKRPLMGQAAGELSTLAIVTSDNPRSEDPLVIIGEIELGLKKLGLARVEPGLADGSFKAGSYMVVPDRRAAIRLAGRLMKPGDVMVVAGKGHEDYQILGNERKPFDDREEARRALEKEGKE